MKFIVPSLALVLSYANAGNIIKGSPWAYGSNVKPGVTSSIPNKVVGTSSHLSGVPLASIDANAEKIQKMKDEVKKQIERKEKQKLQKLEKQRLNALEKSKNTGTD